MLDTFYDAFISYNSKDGDIVEKICAELEDKVGLRIWKDNWEIKGGDIFIEALPHAINKSRCLISFISDNGLGRYQRREVITALQNAIERGSKVIPVYLTKENIEDIPDFLKSHSRLIYEPDDWFLHLLKCAITDVSPGRKDKFVSSPNLFSKLNLVSWEVSHNRLDYVLNLRLNNPGTNSSIIVNSFQIKTNKVKLHPNKEKKDMDFGPITQYYESKPIKVPDLENSVSNYSFNPEQYLKPSEVQDFTFYLKAPEGLKLNVSFLLSWKDIGEKLFRTFEFGCLSIGQKGNYDSSDPYSEEPSSGPSFGGTYQVGQHNLDEPVKVNTIYEIK